MQAIRLPFGLKIAVIPFLTARTPGRVASRLRSREAALEPSRSSGEPEEEILFGRLPKAFGMVVVNDRQRFAGPGGWISRKGHEFPHSRRK